MYEVTIRTRFAAAHQLRGYKGKCESLHGHNWVIEVGLRGAELDNVGLLMDFKVLKMHVGEIMEELDHTLLNDHPWFKERNPSSELIARYIYWQVGQRITAPGLSMSQVRVWESEDSVATYTEESG